jgi:signal transduction histidine kinase
MKNYCLLLLFIISARYGFAHKDTTLSVVYTSKVQNIHNLPPNMHVYIDSNNNTPLQQLRGIMFMHLDEEPKIKVQKKYITDCKIYMLVWIENDETRPRSFYVTPGTYAKECILYIKNAASNDRWVQIAGQVREEQKEYAYRYFTIPPGQEMQILIEAKYARTNLSQIAPYLINPIFIDYHISHIHNNWYGVNIVTYLLCGLLLSMFLFSLANYFQSFKRQFLYYSVYAFCMGLLLFLKAALYKVSSPFNFFYEGVFDYTLLIFGYIFYIGFTRMYLDTPKKYPFLNRIFIVAEIMLVAFLLLYILFYVTNQPYLYLFYTETASKVFLIFLGTMYVVLGFTYRNKFMNYLLAGNITNLICGIISQYLITYGRNSILPTESIFGDSLFYFEIGILVELIFFLFGLAYKNRIELIEKVKMDEAIKLEAERQEYEKELAVLRAQQGERNRISADMHDELGSGVTAIRLLSEIARQKTKENPVDEITKISFNANELMTKMNAIIWSMNTSNDTIGSTIAYIRSYASEYLDNFKIDYKINSPHTIPDVELTGSKRRNIFLVVKECLNNIMKHANASSVLINIKTINNRLHIDISDDGIGIDPEKLNAFGNGLKNMQRRMESIGGKFIILSQAGTTITIEVTY